MANREAKHGFAKEAAEKVCKWNTLTMIRFYLKKGPSQITFSHHSIRSFSPSCFLFNRFRKNVSLLFNYIHIVTCLSYAYTHFFLSLSLWLSSSINRREYNRLVKVRKTSIVQKHIEVRFENDECYARAKVRLWSSVMGYC